MAKLIFESFTARCYKVNVDSGKGVWNIERRSDGELTPWFVCSEDYKEYARVKFMWRYSLRKFNVYCSEIFREHGL